MGFCRRADPHTHPPSPLPFPLYFYRIINSINYTSNNATQSIMDIKKAQAPVVSFCALIPVSFLTDVLLQTDLPLPGKGFLSDAASLL